MDRREFLLATGGAIAAAALPLGAGAGGAASRTASAPHEAFDHYFLTLLDGYLRNARQTSSSFAVCDFPQGTVLKGCVANSGKTYVSVARMLPAIAAWLNAKRTPQSIQTCSEQINLADVCLSVFRNAFDPSHPDYWGEPRTDKADQRQVEASLVAWALWALGDPFVSQLKADERQRVQAWLASCTRVAERKHNHAWFSALNQAARIELSRRWPEFSGDEQWMRDDLKALDAMAAGDGWYNDWVDGHAFDLYNYWTYASHFLLWRQVVGKGYAEIQAPFLGRLRQFLETAPHFFAGDGSHVLFGRSLIYRWATLTPLVLAHQQGLWPHSAGLLRRIVRRSFEFHWKLGAYDERRGKLRETYSSAGTHAVAERYVDNGHPYWCMQAFALFMIPQDDPFWSALEDLLPVERGDYRTEFPRLGMFLSGRKSSGEVRWVQARGLHKEPYRDKYIKFSASSHFPFNVIASKDRCPWDGTLVFRNEATLETAGRSVVSNGVLISDGVETCWSAKLGDMRFEVRSRIRLFGEFELREHEVTAPPGAVGAGIEMLEGSYALGLGRGEQYAGIRRPEYCIARSRRSGHLVACWPMGGGDLLGVVHYFDETGRQGVNIVHPRTAVITLRAPVRSLQTTLVSLHYASPRPDRLEEIMGQARRIMNSRRQAGTS